MSYASKMHSCKYHTCILGISHPNDEHQLKIWKDLGELLDIYSIYGEERLANKP